MLIQRNTDHYKSTIAFVDLLFNILVGFVFLFLVAFLMINPKAKREDIKAKAEFMITLEWPDGNPDDVDLWVRDPMDNKIGFRKKDGGLLHLDRDDLGSFNDVIMVNGEEVIVEGNKETVSIRGIVPGEYWVSAHLYRVNANSFQPIPVRIEVIKVNPYRIIYQQTATFTEAGEVKDFYSFVIDRNGLVSAVSDAAGSAVPIDTSTRPPDYAGRNLPQ